MLIGSLVLFCFAGVFAQDDGLIRDENTTKAYLEDLNARTALSKKAVSLTSWNYMTNVNNQTEKAKIQETLKDMKSTLNNYETLKRFNTTDMQDPTLKRQFKKFLDRGPAALPEEKRVEFNQILSDMVNIYSGAKVNINGEDMSIEPGLTNVLSDMKDEPTLKKAWVGWRDAVGKNVRDDFIKYVQLNNEVAKENGFNNMGEYWIEPYETDNFEKRMDSLWSELEPLYKKLHAFVRMKLKAKWGEQVMPKDGTIPAHLLGNMWAQSWGNTFDLVRPYDAPKGNEATETMKKKSWTEIDLYTHADDFFKLIGLEGVPREFFNKSMLIKPADRQVVCHASAWDFYDGEDFRIKQCTQVQLEDFIVVHHEMGHIQYFMQYKNQPYIFKDGANPGFHEAVGDLMSLSVKTPTHLQSLGLIKDATLTKDKEINYLLEMALEKLSFLPFGFLIDKWRWQVFQGNITPEEYNRKWWEYRIQYQGISPPVKRGVDDFDAGAKYHVAADVPYIRYFVSFIIQFQFHEFLCKEIENKQDLHLCDISSNKIKPGPIISEALSKGSSQPWPEVMKILTGQEEIKTDGIKNYFKKLDDWLTKELKDKKEKIGWEDAKVDSYMNSSSIVKFSAILILITAILHLVI